MLTTIRKRVKVGNDGNVTVPVGIDQAGREVDVVISPPTHARPAVEMTEEQWQEFLRRTAGSIDDPTFRRHEQGEHDKRLPLE